MSSRNRTYEHWPSRASLPCRGLLSFVVPAMLSLLSWPVNLSAQSFPQRPPDPQRTEQQPIAPQSTEPLVTQYAALPDSFDTVTLGLDIDTVKERLGASELYRYRGDPDLSLLPDRSETIIETEGNDFIDRAFFQFHDGNLYIIILHIDDKQFDYYTLYTTFTNRYGEPYELTPQRSEWQSEQVRLMLERPLTVKYIDRQVFESRLQEADLQQSRRSLERRDFLELF